MHKESDCYKNYFNQLLLPETVCYFVESFDETLTCEKAKNRQIFLTVLQNIQFLSHQGLPFWGNNKDGHFEQLIKLSAKADPRITS